MTNAEFIHSNRDSDIRSLALKKMPEGVDVLWCMNQIEGYQLAKRKLPRWSQIEGIWFPPRLSMEQCSSESTAEYKARIAERLFMEGKYTLADLTGGFGVDFSYMAHAAEQSYYIEQQEVLCQTARHNMPLLGLPDAHIINGDSTLLPLDRHFDIIFLDPARRDTVGHKTVAIEDCTPDITELQDTLLSHSSYVIIKLSPMLDITQALRSLHNVIEIHVVSVKGECKELLFVLSHDEPAAITTYCANLETKESTFISKKCGDSFKSGSDPDLKKSVEIVNENKLVNCLLFEPNASIMKAGLQDSFAIRHGLKKLHPMSNLYIMEKPTLESFEDYPARVFRVCDVYDFSKSEQKRLRSDIKSANITIRNFPSTVAELRKRLKIKEGGNDYLFVTTVNKESCHKIILCRKA